jgi:tRNA uridine 5-carboxymethylaminomethyl modification enzyme
VLAGARLPREISAFELLRRPEVRYEDVALLAGEADFSALDPRVPPAVRTQVEVRAKYAGYIERQSAEIERQSRYEQAALPEDLDYAGVPGLSTEERQRLSETRPATLGQAARIPGVTPAAISLLLVHLKRRSRAA